MDDTPTRLAEPARAWIADRIASGAWPDEAAYLNHLVARDRDDVERLAALHAALDEGDASGICDLSIEDIIAKARARNLAKA